MAIRDEKTATEELLRDARYHGKALESDPETVELAPAVRENVASLRTRRNATQDAEEEQAASLAGLIRTDVVGDDNVRLVELEVLGRCRKDRKAPEYRACFPRGLTWLLSLRGEAQARESRSLVAALRTHFPDLAERWAETLLKDADAMAAAEPAYKEALQRALDARRDEVLARFELVQQLRKNEGALTSLFPGKRPLVRSFFRPTAKKSEAPVEEKEETPEE